MADRLREGRALVTPADPDAPYSDPVTAAPAAAGRELDALVAEKVFGCKATHRLDGSLLGAPVAWCDCGAGEHAAQPFDADDPLDTPWLPFYSTDIAAAWLVVEHLQKTHRLSFALGLNACAGGHQNGAKFFEGFRGLGHDIFDNAEHEGWYAVDETAPLAICKAALSLASANTAAVRPPIADEER